MTGFVWNVGISHWLLPFEKLYSQMVITSSGGAFLYPDCIRRNCLLLLDTPEAASAHIPACPALFFPFGFFSHAILFLQQQLSCVCRSLVGNDVAYQNNPNQHSTPTRCTYKLKMTAVTLQEGWHHNQYIYKRDIILDNLSVSLQSMCGTRVDCPLVNRSWWRSLGRV